MTKTRNHLATALALTVLALGGAALAGGGHHHRGHEPDHGQQQGHGPSAEAEPGAAADTPATRAFREADKRMHRDMAIRYTNDVDADFLRGMIPHHRGAVDMAKVALAHSKDPQVRTLAKAIVAAQEDEIRQMEALLRAHAAR